MSTERLAPLLAILASLILMASLALLAVRALRSGDDPAPPSDEAAEAERPLLTPPILQDFDLGGDFVLLDQNGEPFDLAEQRGRVFLLFFGYTRCPDFCPATLSLMTRVYELLGERAGEVTTLFVSIDPEHDTQDRLREYLGYFGITALGLTGTPEQIDTVVDAYAGIYEAAESTATAADGHGSAVLFGHSTYTYLIDGEGRVRYLFRPDDTPRFIAAGVIDALP